MPSFRNDDTAGTWKIEQRTDRVTGTPSTTSTLNVNAISPITGNLYTGELQLLCFKNQPVVRIAFNYKIGSNRSAAMAYRFDDNPGREAEARFLLYFWTIVIEDPAEVARFIEVMKPASMMFLRVDSLVVGRTTMQLAVRGAPAAIDAAYSTCPPASLRRAESRPSSAA